MPVSPQDFALYSRMTGAPVPTDAATRMQMAPDVYKFTKDFAKKPNILEKSGNLLKNIAKTTLMGAAGLAAAPSLVEQQQTTVEQPKTTADRVDQDTTENQTARKVVERKGTQYADSQNNKTIAEDVTEDQYLGEPMFRPVQMPSMKPAVGVATPVEMPSMKAAVAPVNEGFADPKRVQKQMESDMVGASITSKKVSEFLGQKGLEPLLIAAIAEREQEEKFSDHPDIIGGEDDSNLPGSQNMTVNGMNTSSTTDLSAHHKEMRKMDAMERNKESIDEIVDKTPTQS